MVLVHQGLGRSRVSLFKRRHRMSSRCPSDSDNDDDRKRRRSSRLDDDDDDGDDDSVICVREKRQISQTSPSEEEFLVKRSRLSTGSERAEGDDIVQSTSDTQRLVTGHLQSSGVIRNPGRSRIQSDRNTQKLGSCQSQSVDETQNPITSHVQSEKYSHSPGTCHVQSEKDVQNPRTSHVQSEKDTHNPCTSHVQSDKDRQKLKTADVQSARQKPTAYGRQPCAHHTHYQGQSVPGQAGPKLSQGQSPGVSTSDKSSPQHVTKISHKVKINNQLLAFEKPVSFFRWFERIEKFLQQASHVPGVQKTSPRSQPSATQAAASQAAGPKPAVPPVTDSHTGSSQTVTIPQPTIGPQVATYVTQTAPTIAPKISGIGQSTVGGGQTFLVPVAGASANGTMTLIGPPGGTNLSSSQYRFTPVQPAPKPTGVTVREMLDSKQSSTGTLPVSQVNITTNTGQSDKSGVHEKVIDLTEDEENNTSKVPLTPITLTPGQVIVQSSLTSTSNSGNLPSGTYLVPVTSGQPIILQSVVQPQLQQPLLLSTARPGISQQQIAPAGQQLVTLTPAQGGIRPLLVQTPAATQSVSTAKVAVTTQVVTKSVPPAHTTTIKPVTSKQMKHPAPLPPQPTTSKISPEYKTPPPKPKLTISRVPQGIVLSWNLSLTDSHAAISNYQLYAYQEGTSLPVSSLWKRVGDVKALPLPMACTLTQFHEGNKYHFAVRGVDEHGRIGPFSDPNSIHLAAVSTS